MDSPTGKRVLTSSQDNFIMQARVPESVIWQWGLSPWKQVSTEWLALCLAKNGNPLLGRGTWAWHSKFLSFLSFGSWLMPSVHYQKKKKKSQRLASSLGQSAGVCCPAQGRSGKQQRHRQPADFRNHNVGQDPQAEGWYQVLKSPSVSPLSR